MVHLDKEDPKGKEDKTEWSYLNIPDPDRREVSTFSSDKVSPVLRPETKDVKRAQASIFHYSALDSTIISYFHTFTSGITVRQWQHTHD